MPINITVNSCQECVVQLGTLSTRGFAETAKSVIEKNGVRYQAITLQNPHTFSKWTLCFKIAFYSAMKIFNRASYARKLNEAKCAWREKQVSYVFTYPLTADTSSAVSGKGIPQVGVSATAASAQAIARAAFGWDSLVEKALTQPIPTHNNRIATLGQTDEIRGQIVKQAKETHPILHAKVWAFIDKFLDLKRMLGTKVEEKLYSTMTKEDFVQRLLEKRPYTFWKQSDDVKLQNGKQIDNATQLFDEIKDAPLTAEINLKDYLSYDEMQLAAYLGVSTPTFFINNGNRHNMSLTDALSFEKSGVYVGMVGARFERPNHMEDCHMIVRPDRDSSNDLNRLWGEFIFSLQFCRLPSYKEASAEYKANKGRYIQLQDNLGNPVYFDTLVYRLAMTLRLEAFLLDANARAQKEGKLAYLHLVALGCGEWSHVEGTHLAYAFQNIQVGIYYELLQKHKLANIGTLNFSRFDQMDKIYQLKQLHVEGAKRAIEIEFSKRNPADTLEGKDQKKLLIAMYECNSNSYPGNEFWINVLNTSGDSAAASCSTIAELQNPLVNPYVSGDNVAVYSPSS